MIAADFLSPEWLELYRAIIRGGATGDDLSGVDFGMYELFKNVPPHVQNGRGTDILFGFRIVDGLLEFPDQPWDDAAFKLVADFEAIAPWANLSTELTKASGLFERLIAAGKLRFSGGLSAAPRFLQELNLHDRLAEITAPYTAAPDWEA
jgi:hypothetical protein